MILRKYKEPIRRLLPRARNDHRIWRGPLKGSKIYTSWHDYPGAILGSTEGPLLQWLCQHVQRGETWLDVGAHYGYTALALSKMVGHAGRVIAFEPVLATAACISRTRMLNGISWLQVVPVGLGSAAVIDTKLLPVVRGMADSTIDKKGWMEPILIASFDDLAAGLLGESRKVDGVKIDVQGMELAVLLGMRRTLCAYHPKLIVEFHSGVNRPEILDLLQDCGYRKDGKPVDSSEDAGAPAYADDHNYAFFPEADTSDHARLSHSIVSQKADLCGAT